MESEQGELEKETHLQSTILGGFHVGFHGRIDPLLFSKKKTSPAGFTARKVHHDSCLDT